MEIQEKYLELSSHQKKVLDQMLEFIRTPAKSAVDFYFCLQGYAGTGKTTIISRLIQLLLGKTTIAITAPTHKAKRILKEKSNVEAITVHSLLGIKLNTDIANFDINKPNFDPKNAPQLENFGVIIVDEASMLNKDLLALIKKENSVCKKKIIFVGDPAQLPPVGEEMSLVFKLPNKAILTEVHRTEDSNIIDLCTYIRNNLDKNTIPLSQFEGEKIIRKDSKEFYQIAYEEFNNMLFGQEKNLNHSKILSYTNKSVSAINKHIRSMLIKSDNRLEIGDILTSYTTIGSGSDIVILNSEDYFVTAIETEMSSYNITCLRLTLLSSDQKVTEVLIVEDYSKFSEIFFEKLSAAKENFRKWGEYYNFKEEHLLFSDFVDNRGKLICKKDLDYGYALTVHKSQGSSFNNVFIMNKNIGVCATMPLRNQLRYVAFSRAVDKIIYL